LCFFFIAPSVFIKCLHGFRIIVHLQIDSLLFTTDYTYTTYIYNTMQTYFC
jgi:hypothetical protein